jgi:hypothetical protein
VDEVDSEEIARRHARYVQSQESAAKVTVAKRAEATDKLQFALR